MKHLRTYRLFEGGNALELVRPIKQSEVAGTISAIEDAILPSLGLSGFGTDCMVMGSAGKKASPDDESGDIDVGFDVSAFSSRHNIDPGIALKYLHDLLKREFPAFQSKWLRGVEVVSFGYPIANDPGKGYVQVDFIPLKDMKWANFIYYAPDHRTGESVYKSAHRNWLFAAILSQIIEDEKFDLDGNKLGYSGYMLRLADGLSKISKTYIGKTKLLKNSVKVSDVLVTNSPEEFVEFLFGPGVRPKAVVTFESCWRIINSPNFIWSDKLDGIKDALLRFLKRARLTIPTEMK